MGLLDSIWDTKLNYTTLQLVLVYYNRFSKARYSISKARSADTEPHAELRSSEVTGCALTFTILVYQHLVHNSYIL